ncbi:MAG: DUF4202 domain-containing protein [Gammaproteobacteria bacterium]|nr:MAG: DUF4202 domain-containing protein [Gammaproteobacteria bacterium]
MTQKKFEVAVELIDAANSEDTNLETSDGKELPKELLYSHRMSDMQQRYAADTDDAMKLALRAQHIQRWKYPRNEYPMDRKGYHLWRTNLYSFHADTVAALLLEAGYDDEFIKRVKLAVSKKSLNSNLDTQLLEDVSALVFIEHYMLAFVEKHPEYDEDKWISIIKRTWNKMTEKGHAFALSGSIKLPGSLIPLIQKAVSSGE